MSIANKLKKLPKWSHYLFAVVLGLTFSVIFPTVDSGTDIHLGVGLIRVKDTQIKNAVNYIYNCFQNGHPHWGLLILFPVGLNTLFVLINCCNQKKLLVFFYLPLIFLQGIILDKYIFTVSFVMFSEVYPQSIALSNMYSLVRRTTELEQYKR